MIRVHAFIFGVVSLCSSHVLAQWSAPGHDFNGGINLGGQVTSNSNPWVWKLGKNTELSIPLKEKSSKSDGQWDVPLPESTILLGKTIRTVPSGREGLMPVIRFGNSESGGVLKWEEPGVAKITLQVNDGKRENIGKFTFKIKVAAILKAVFEGHDKHYALYNDTNGNGLPERHYIASPARMLAELRGMFKTELPLWLSKNITITDIAGVSKFTDSSLRQVNGIYGAQIISGSGELQLEPGTHPSNWHVSLPVSIIYQ